VGQEPLMGCVTRLIPLIAMAKSEYLCLLPSGQALLTARQRFLTSFTSEQLSSMGERVRAELATEGGVNRLVVGYGRNLLDSSEK
jgi:hypothetical protein